ncbi:MAG: phage major capsid protein [Patescibacteria group bacterium]|nr:phage major capsid protein [Patescibacteria group bacterium]
MALPPFAGTGMVPSTGAIFTELNAVTRRAFVPRLVVQIYKAAPLLSMAMRNAQKARGGLNQITVPVQGASFVNFSWTDYSGGFPQPSVQAAMQDAAWNLSVGVVPIPLLGMESLIQATEAVIPIVKARMADAKTVAVQSIATALYASNGGNQLAINGLLDVYDDGTVATTYGGISRTAATFWKSTIYSTSITPSRSTMIARIMQLTKLAGGEGPDVVVMSMGDWTTLLADFMTAEQFHTTPDSRYGNDDAINAGFRCLMLGNTAILADPFCPTGTAYLINSKYLALYISEDANFAFSGFQSLIANNQIASVGVVISAMALACSKPVSGMQLSNVAGAAF